MKLLEIINQLDIQTFIILNKALNYNIVPYFLLCFSFFFDIKTFTSIFSCLLLIKFLKLRKTKKLIKKDKYYLEIYNKQKFDLCYLIRFSYIYTLLVIVFFLIKNLTNRARPFCSLPPENFSSLMEPDYSVCFSSFPSFHVGLAFLLLMTLWKISSTWKKLIMIIIVLEIFQRVIKSKKASPT